MATETPIEQTDAIKDLLRASSGDVLKITSVSSITRDKGYYGVCFAVPSKAVRSVLSVDKEILILVTTFQDQQVRTIQTARDLIEESEGRLDSSAVIIIHCDPRGNTKLKKWGRELSLAVLPIFFDGRLPQGEKLLHALALELYSYDIFDVTGPVADDMQFYGRREEALDFAKKLQNGQIRSCFGIRKIGKTSILYRIINEMKKNYDCTIILIDAQRDAVFEMDAARLINSLAISLDAYSENSELSVSMVQDSIDISIAAERLRLAISSHNAPVIFVFDEIDYLTPTSPTAPHWRSEFNKFWRNLRAIYQSSAASSRNFSMLISGVSSKWFAEESIDGVENAALLFVPEEYLSPLPRGAATAMIRKLGRTAGLTFADKVAEEIADTCADMPFWIRKSCSYIHGKIDISLRPFEPHKQLISEYLKEFVASDGAAMSEVALAHLFRVYPELRGPALQCAQGHQSGLDARTLRALEKYGIIRRGRNISISGQMMAAGLQSFISGADRDDPAQKGASDEDARANYGDWADELAIISRRRNVLERKLRSLVANFIRYSVLSAQNSDAAKDRVLKCIDAKRRSGLQHLDLDDLMTKLFWLETIYIIKKEWSLFEKIFGDRANLDRNSAIVNERPDAHAKELDLADIANHRIALEWFEERLARV